MAPMARSLLNQFNVTKSSPPEEFIKALKPLSLVNWKLQYCAWKGLLTVQNPDGSWKMRNEDRAQAEELSKEYYSGF